MTITEYVEYLVKSICKENDMIKSSTNIVDDKTIIDVLVPSDIMGVVLGSNGKNIKAIRTLASAYQYSRGEKNVEIHIESF